MDLCKLKPVEILRLVNSVAPGTLTETRLRRDRSKVGYKIGGETTVDALKYAAYLTLKCFEETPKSTAPTGYEAVKQAARDRASESVRAAQDIGELPPVKDPERKRKAFESFRFFCDAYFSRVFYLPWSTIHVAVAEKLERVICNGEIYALAMPRGSGKTTLNEIAVLWATMTGKTNYASLIAASSDRAQQLLDHLKAWLEGNDELLADFPEVCYPIRKLGRVVNRQRGQRYRGVHTLINWGATEIVFPTIEGSVASGARIQCAGMNGAEIRGLGFVNSSGDKVRPSLALVDDPQTRESARSVSQCNEREQIIKADILGMAGPGKPFACCITMTVIAENDLAQRLLNRKSNPEFRGERYQLLDSLPENVDLWNEYRNLREASLQNDGDGSEATDFYEEHRAEMDAGAVATWPERYDERKEISAVQYAMNLRFRDEEAFQSEYQNLPVVTEEGEGMLNAVDIANKTSGYQRGVAPTESQFVTGFIDVHKNLLYWILVAWERNFNGFVVDYGTFPEQKLAVFRMSEARPTLADVCPNAGMEGAILNGLKKLTERFFVEGVKRDDGMGMRVDKVLIDANWGQTDDQVYQFCRQSPFGANILPSHGSYIGASSRPFRDYKPKRGDLIGIHWRIPNELGKRPVRHVFYDTNYWKSFTHARLATQQGDPGCLSINGDANEHALLASHLTAEYRVAVTTEKTERRVEEWKLRRSRPDNHWLDCLAGATVAASVCGAVLPSLRPAAEKKKKKRVSFAELQRRNQQRSYE